MKKLLYLGIVLMLASCGASTVKIGNLEVMTKDLGNMNWYDAKSACAELEGGWRLPTKDELNVLYENQDKIGGFVSFSFYYWSSTENGSTHAYRQNFTNGKQKGGSRTTDQFVRAVRSI